MEERLPALTPAPPQQEVNISREVINFFYAVRRRQKLMVFALALSAALGGLYYATATRIYESKASLAVTQNQSASWYNKPPSDPTSRDPIDTYRSMFISPVVLEKAIESLQPEDRTDLGDGTLEEAVKKLQRNLWVSAVRKTNILEIVYRSQNPRAAAAVVSAVLSAFQDFIEKNHKSTTRERFELLDKQRANLDKQLSDKAAEKLSLQSKMDDAYIRAGDKGQYVSMTAERLWLLNKQASEARIARQKAQAQLEALEDAIRDGRDLQPFVMALLGPVGQDLVRQRMRISATDAYTIAQTNQELRRDRAEWQRLMNILGPNHSKVIELAIRINHAENFLRGVQGDGGETRAIGRELIESLRHEAYKQYQEACRQESLALADYEKQSERARKLQDDIAKLESLDFELESVSYTHLTLPTIYSV